MTERPRNCPKCGGSLPPEALDGACPRCMLAEGLLVEDDAHAAAPVGSRSADSAADSDGGSPARPRPAPPSIDEIAQHFPALDIEELIGAGGMGIVYRARQTALDRRVALKVLWPELAADPSFADRFTREARAMARLDHPNIVRVFECGERGGLCFLVMELVDGKNLRQLLDEGGVRPEEALAIVPQICAALQYAHDQGVVHRDIKPANVLVDVTGRVRIVDFGLAKLVEGDDVTLTRAGQVMGTLQYMAPEQYKTPDAVDHRADIYSLGVVFYEMLTGDVPVGRFEAPSERVRVDVRLDQVVLRSLERQPELRYQNAADVGTAVTSISSGDGERLVPPVASVPLDTAAAPAAALPVAEKPPSRLSKLAVASLGVVALQLVFALTALAAPPVIVLSIFAAGLAMCMGFVALIRVLGSSGRLHGAGYAFAAMLAPIFVGCGGFLLLGSVAAQHGVRGMEPVRIDEDGVTFGEFRIDEDGVRVGDWVEVTDRGVLVREPIEIDDRGVRRIPQRSNALPEGLRSVSAPSKMPLDVRDQHVREIVSLWESVVALEPAVSVERALTAGLYSDAALRDIRARSPEDVAEARERDALGLPLVSEATRAELRDMAVTRVEFGGYPLRAYVTAGGGGSTVTFYVAQDAGEWRFESSAVETAPAESEPR